MSIGQRLAFRFTIVSALVTGAILILIYILARGFLHGDFVDRLAQQSSLEIMHYASPEIKDVIPEGYFNQRNPSVAIYSENHSLLYHQGTYTVRDTWIKYLSRNDEFNAEQGNYTTVGRKHLVNDTLYLVFVSDRDLLGERELIFLRNAILVSWAISLLLSYNAGLHFASKALQPVRHVIQDVNQITEDNLDYRLETDEKVKPDEIGELVLTFNALLARIQKAFISQKRFVQNASHELKTPLTAIIAEVELALAKERPPEEYQRVLKVVIHEAERLARTTQELLTLARLEEGISDNESVSLQELWGQILHTVDVRHPGRIEVLQKDVIPNCYIYGSKQLLQTCFQNLLDNACKYSSEKIQIGVECTDKEVKIKIADRGIGIPETELSRVRTPLFRASNVFSIPGAGLGLALVERIVVAHRGRLQIESKEGEGTQCTVILPFLQTLK